MATIKLSIRNSRARQVQAKFARDRDGGNAVLRPQASVEWKAQGNDVFRVVFFDVDMQAWIFPFDGNHDGAFGPDSAPSLEVSAAGTTRSLKSGAPLNLKYEVYCTSEQTADPLDPMIIIRPSASKNIVVVAVTSALAGVAVGALLIFALLH